MNTNSKTEKEQTSDDKRNYTREYRWFHILTSKVLF